MERQSMDVRKTMTTYLLEADTSFPDGRRGLPSGLDLPPRLRASPLRWTSPVWTEHLLFGLGPPF